MIGSEEYFRRNKPLFYFLIKDIKLVVYTGAEPLIIGDQKNVDSLNISEKVKGQYLRMAFHKIKDSVRLIRVANHSFRPQLNQFEPADTAVKFDIEKLK